MNLTEERYGIYEQLRKSVRNTPLKKIERIHVPNDVNIYVKEEFKNPTGSHYDRQTVELFRGKELAGDISPGSTSLFETSTGSSGASFAWVAKVLGYLDPVIIIPGDMPAARIAQIKSYGALVKHSPCGLYIDGLIKEYARFQKKHPEKVFLDHSNDQKFSTGAMEELGAEIICDLAELGEKASYLVVALGNGISGRGLSNKFKDIGAKVYGMEPYESPGVAHAYFSGTYKAKFDKDFKFSSRHIVYGTGAGRGKEARFPHLKPTADNLEDIFHPNKSQVLEMKDNLMYKEHILAGHSSAACMWSAIELAKKCKRGENIVTVMYDAAWRYLELDSSESYLD